MPQIAKVIAYHSDLVGALRAAIVVAGKDPYDAIRLVIDPAAEIMQVCAVDKNATFVAEVRLELAVDVIEEHRRVELSIAEAKRLASHKIKTEGEAAKSGLAIGEKRIRLTDETGIGMALRGVDVLRLSQPTLTGDMAKTIRDAHNALPGDSTTISADQAALIGSVANALGRSIRRIHHLEEPPTRKLVAGHGWALTTTGRENEPPVDDEAPDDPDPSFEDVTLQVVTANPPKGAA